MEPKFDGRQELSEPFIPGLRYLFSKLFHQTALRLSNLHHRDPIIVFTMGKVGSKSIAESIHAILPKVPVYHVHYITQEGLAFHKHVSLSPHRLQLGRPHWTGHYLRKEINKNHHIWNVITLVRDPIARNISAFFYDIKRWIPNFDDSYVDSTEKIDMIKNVFLEEFPSEIPLTWLDQELKDIFGVDVYNSQFPLSIGYQLYSGVHANLLLIRLEDLNNVIDEAMKKYLNIDDFKLLKANIASESRYSGVYRKFLSQVSLPEDYVTKMYSSRFAKHFYSINELEGFRTKWLNARY